MNEVRRGDGELCGFVSEREGRWLALTVFGGALGDHPDAGTAEAQVVAEGLAALTERWFLVDAETGEEEVVCIVEAHPGEVTLALGHYSLPGVPTRVLTDGELAGDRWALRRAG